MSSTLLLIIAMSMLVTPLLFIIYDQLSKRLQSGDTPEADEVDQRGKVIIAGVGRFGQIVNRLVQSAGFSTVVIDNDLATVQMVRKFGFTGFFGDPTRPDLLSAAGLDDARVLVVAIDDPASANKLVTYARKAHPDLHIIARAHDRVHVYQLYAAGANDIVREMFDGSLRAGRYALETLGLSDFEAAEAEQTFFHHDRAAVRELAQLWEPGVALADIPAYVKRARELNRDLETALGSRPPKDD